MRLIDADALRNVFDAMHAIPGGSHFDHLVLLGIKKHIDDTPTIDAVPVVRCRECVFRGQHDLCPMNVRVYMLDEAAYLDCTEDDGFCHKGEKMDGGAADGV